MKTILENLNWMKSLIMTSIRKSKAITKSATIENAYLLFTIQKSEFLKFALLHLHSTVLVLLLVLTVSLCSGQKPIMDDMEFWRLGYRMVWNVEFENNNELAENQLDSLLSYGNVLEDKILYVGIKGLHRNDKMDRIKAIIEKIDSSTFAYLCSKDLFKNELKNLISCEQYFQEEKVSIPDLQRQLVVMFIDDQNDRLNRMDNLIKKYNVQESELIALDNYKVHVDVQNQRLLKEIISKYGFPTKSMVGSDGMDAIFHIIQHAGNDDDWQAAQLQLVENAVKLGDMEMKNFVYLYDRIKLHANLPQRWGTQCSAVKKKENLVVLHPVEDPENLDKRRREAGLEPIDFYKKLMLLH